MKMLQRFRITSIVIPAFLLAACGGGGGSSSGGGGGGPANQELVGNYTGTIRATLLMGYYSCQHHNSSHFLQ